MMSTDPGTGAARVPYSIRASATRNINAMSMARVRLLVSELEVDEFIRVARVEDCDHQDEVEVPGSLHEPRRAKQPPEAVFGVRHPLDGEKHRCVERDHEEPGLCLRRNAPL